MPRRNVILATNEVYHLYNRSIAKETIFSSMIHLRKLLEIADYYRFPQALRLSQFKLLPKDLRESYLISMKEKTPLVEIYSFAFMPNHCHFLLKQVQDSGILKFFSNFQNSYAKIFNLMNKRDGSLFQSPFKAKRIENDEQFLHVSRYIHLNPVTSYLIKLTDLVKYPWTSFPKYVNPTPAFFVKTEAILAFFKSKEEYIKFVEDQADYQRQLAAIKDLLME